MAQAHATPRREEVPSPRAGLDLFLSDLSALSREYGIGVTGEAVLFVMEGEDFHYDYRVDEESRLLRQVNAQAGIWERYPQAGVHPDGAAQFIQHDGRV